jgi:amidase
MKILSDASVHVEYPVSLPLGDNVWPGIEAIICTLLSKPGIPCLSTLTKSAAYEFQHVFNHYLKTLHSCPVMTLEELIEWNRQHADRELPNGRCISRKFTIGFLLI